MAVRSMTNGEHRKLFMTGVLGGLILPIALLAASLVFDSAATALSFVAGVTALGGMWSYEHSYVLAGQSVPLS